MRKSIALFSKSETSHQAIYELRGALPHSRATTWRVPVDLCAVTRVFVKEVIKEKRRQVKRERRDFVRPPQADCGQNLKKV